jgi:serine/threonine protein kinase
MSPEQANGLSLDGRSDIYGLGVVLFEAITGREPYQAETPMALLLKHINEPMPPMKNFREGVPDTVQQVVSKATAKDPNQRYMSATLLANAFAEAVKSVSRVSNPGLKWDVFLSYSRKDSAVMQRICADLRSKGVKVWVDEESIEPGTPMWESAVANAIRGAKCLVVILSPDAEQSVWVGRELAMAESLDKRILPILVRGDERNAVPFRLMSHQRVDGRHHYEEALQKLLNALQKHLNTID